MDLENPLRCDAGSLCLPVCATRQCDGEQRAQSDRNAPHELHAVSSSHTPPPPQVGDMEDYRGSPVRGTSPALGLRQKTYPAFPPSPAFLRDSGETRCHS